MDLLATVKIQTSREDALDPRTRERLWRSITDHLDQAELKVVGQPVSCATMIIQGSLEVWLAIIGSGGILGLMGFLGKENSYRYAKQNILDIVQDLRKLGDQLHDSVGGILGEYEIKIREVSHELAPRVECMWRCFGGET